EIRPEGRSMPMRPIGTPIIAAAGAHAMTRATRAVPGLPEVMATAQRPEAVARAPITDQGPRPDRPRRPTGVPVAGARGPINPRAGRPPGAAATAGLPAVAGARGPFKVQGAAPGAPGPVGPLDPPVRAEGETKIGQINYELNF